VFPVQSLIKYIHIKHHAEHELFWFGEKPSLEHDVSKKLEKEIKALKFLRVWSGKRRREKEFIALCRNLL
jgi:hypothetical protein